MKNLFKKLLIDIWKARGVDTSLITSISTNIHGNVHMFLYFTCELKNLDYKPDKFFGGGHSTITSNERISFDEMMEHLLEKTNIEYNTSDEEVKHIK